MLRTLLLLFAGALALTGAILLLRGVAGPGAYALGLGGVIVLGTAFERWRYRPHDLRPDGGWQPTGERFEDPQTGSTVQVFYDPRSGERRYVSDPGPPPGPGIS
ncbi:MAG TPA: hypothetical protein VNX02_16215 [Steroidobacteraceae bacterium]|nr:hypothetical protein [Steroidobacteraceae bacterium]